MLAICYNPDCKYFRGVVGVAEDAHTVWNGWYNMVRYSWNFGGCKFHLCAYCSNQKTAQKVARFQHDLR